MTPQWLLFLFFSCLLHFVNATNVANVLIYSYTAGYRHDSIPTAISALVQRGPDKGISFTNTEDPDHFTDSYLSQYDALFFLSTTEEVLNASGLAAFQRYLDLGGNFIGVHAASACLYNSTTYERTLGSQFQYHPQFQNATMVVTDDTHPSTSGLPHRWNVQDEVYYFVQNPRDLGAVVVLAADESSYVDGAGGSPSEGDPHPIAWYQEHLKGTNSTGLVGRSWYSALGHAPEAWENDLFMDHIMGGVLWTLASNTTRSTNPDASVGSLGPIWQTPEPAPTTTVDLPGDSSAARWLPGYLGLLLPSFILMVLSI